MPQKRTAKALTSYGVAALQLIANKRLQSQMRDILEDYDLNLTQWLIISRLREKPDGQRTTDLAHFMHVEVPLITMMVRPLRMRGLITSSVESLDKREKFLRMTAQAKAMVEAVEKRLEKRVANLTKDVSWQDLQTYLKVLRSMVASPV